MTQPLRQFPLRLRLLRGRHLRRADWTTGESDPYAEVWLAEGGQKQRTRVATNTRNPLWNHDFSFTLTAGEADTLHVQVYDEDIGKRDELLGEVAIPLPAGAPAAKASRRGLSASLAGVTGKVLGLASDHLLLGVPKEEGGPLRSARSASGGRVHGVPTKPPPASSGGVDEHRPHFFAEAFTAHHADTPLLSDALLAAGYTAAWHALTPERSGEVAIAIGPPPAGGAGGGAGAPPGGDPPSLPIPIPFQVYNASLLTKVAASFPTYTLQVHSVASVFGDARCAWNRSYRPAQQIFAAGPQALMARSLIRAQHARLCGGGLALDDGLVSSLRRAFAGLTGAAASAAEFFALTHHGVRGGKSRFFTYVLLAGDRAGGARLRFSETGASFWADVRSKHAVHSNAAAEVVYSGEFHIRTGTYAPDKARLPLLREVLRRNFPDMAVEVVDFQGPVVAAAKEAIKLHGII
ncbi:hypothetical protein BU14_0290s0010 [Porphyra umbilicalis]|uniref:C2 domain-containing protein n=1 Tax=Porphyra umbilicalis TaxID=2786 RepID=A0A1X6P0M2_PORUM|nr:hypothetical protein BU14_0290s0010 [Porphyra umbilicalis]|eukprot:OSX74402.1 hypothetical protein BU14_0290s0010 [Porphyra umbilicalis]